MMGAATFVVNPNQPDAFTITLSGRDLWTLERLMNEGATGCTPIEQPAPRWSAYVHRLREMGVVIITHMEPHGGEFPGRHARYVLGCTLERVLGDG
jgi:hypothetical protein